MIAYILHETDDIKSLILWGIFAFFIFFSVVIDLIFGLIKTKSQGERIKSKLLRRTTSKLTMYLCLFILCFFIDSISTYIWPWDLPYLSVVVAIFIIFIEIKSIFENAGDREKDDMIKTSKMLIKLYKQGRDIDGLEKLIDELKKEKNENN